MSFRRYIFDVSYFLYNIESYRNPFLPLSYMVFHSFPCYLSTDREPIFRGYSSPSSAFDGFFKMSDMFLQDL